MTDYDALLDGNFSTAADLIPHKGGGEYQTPPLAESAQVDPVLAATGSPWLDEYIAHSSRWSPRAYHDFHEAVGLWLLSTVAARRVAVSFGQTRYTNLYIALCARTSIYAKSTTADIAQEIMRAAGLDYLMAPDDATPQAFVQLMSYKLPGKWGDMTDAERSTATHRLAFAGQRGWFFDEFGMKVSAMMRDSGHMTEFRGLLRRLDDNPEAYEYVTISRGSDVIQRPYLALLANMTPADLEPYAKKNSALWNDGFWARYAFVTPPADYPRSSARFPKGIRIPPPSLVAPLRQWHQQLGVRLPDVTERESEGKTIYDLLAVTPEPVMLDLSPAVFDAIYTYRDALEDIIFESQLTDLDGNYSRLPEKALRVSMLLASLDGCRQIEARHWARGQQVAETWRRNLHNLYTQLMEGGASTPTEDMEQKIMKLLADKGPQTKREVYTFVRGLDSTKATYLLDHMVKADLLHEDKSGRAVRYSLNGVSA